jgi:RNA polymerase sigma factor (sigma-70 family)
MTYALQLAPNDPRVCRSNLMNCWIAGCQELRSIPATLVRFAKSNFRQLDSIIYSTAHKVTSLDRKSQQWILPRIASGEPQAMDLCIHQYGGIVWAIARRYLSNTTEAEDLVQEVFTEVWKKSAAFDPEIASESTFVGLIARRRAIDFVRRSQRRPAFEPLTAAESLPLPSAQTTSTRCDTEEILSSISALPDDTRKLFELFFQQGMTHPEIADQTGIPLGTIKTRLRRGLITLRDHFQRTQNSNTPSEP